MNQQKNIRHQLPRGGALNPGWGGGTSCQPITDPYGIVFVVRNGKPVTNVSSKEDTAAEDEEKK